MNTKTLGLLTCLSGGALYLPSPTVADDLKPDPKVKFESVIASIERNDLSGEEIRAIKIFKSLAVIDLNGIEQRDHVQALRRALRRTDDGWAEIQTALVNNRILHSELDRRSVDIGRIVAATRDEAGLITIFLR